MLELLLAGGVNSRSGYWNLINETTNPRGRQHHALAALSGQLYLYGGYHFTSFMSDLWVYDLTPNKWTQKANGPAGVLGHLMVAIDGKLYIFGGQTSSGNTNNLSRYDPVSNTWTAMAVGPGARRYHAGAVVDGKMYIHGGTTGGTSMLADFWVYNPATNTWTQLPSGPPGTRYQQAVALNGKFYIYGGEALVNGVIVAVDDIWEYDPQAGTWKKSIAGIGARYRHRLFELAGTIYVHSGENRNTGTTVYFNEFLDSVAFQNWRTLPNTPGYYLGHSGAVLNGKLYLSAEKTTEIQRLWEYNP